MSMVGIVDLIALPLAIIAIVWPLSLPSSPRKMIVAAKETLWILDHEEEIEGYMLLPICCIQEGCAAIMEICCVCILLPFALLTPWSAFFMLWFFFNVVRWRSLPLDLIGNDASKVSALDVGFGIFSHAVAAIVDVVIVVPCGLLGIILPSAWPHLGNVALELRKQWKEPADPTVVAQNHFIFQYK